MSTSTPTIEQATEALVAAGKAWRRASSAELTRRAARDEAIREAASAGLGVREIARQAQVDPTQVSRVLSR
jgi:hypothetical protein